MSRKEYIDNYIDREARAEFVRANAEAIVSDLEKQAERRLNELRRAVKANNNRRREIARLTKALHANRCHPDFTYIPVPQKATIDLVVTSGWEPNPEWQAVAPGDVCYRRRKS